MNERLAYIAACLAASSTVTLFFYLLASGRGYSQTDVIIGSLWTFVLAAIISSPVLIPVIRKRLSS